MKRMLLNTPRGRCLSAAFAIYLLMNSGAGAQTRSRHRAPESGGSPDDTAPTPTVSPSATGRGHTRRGKDSRSAAADSPPSGVAARITAPAGRAGEKQPPTVEAAPTKTSTDSGLAPSSPGPAATASIDPAEIEDFDVQPEAIRQLLSTALELARRNLTYAYGSADPAAGGLDCSGAIYYLLHQRGFEDVPRQASEQYCWVREHSRFYAVLSKKADNPELNELRPGDLLFWTGTYHVDRDPPVTHSMIYLGRRKRDGHRLMFGSSDGRTYDGVRRNGVSVFDFHLPPARHGDADDANAAAAPDHAPDFAGYGPVPGMADLIDAASRQTAAGRAAGAPADGQTKDEPAAPAAKSRRGHATHPPAG